jgi:DNA repair exonuclease SbcCD ATPase subunit
MSDISASERRLSAALDRLDQLLDMPQAAPASAPASDNHEQIDLLTRQLAEAQARIAKLQQAAPIPDDNMRQKLDAATSNNAELSTANDALASANRDLIEAQDTGGIGTDEIRDALQAEVTALRAARQAEIAQMGEIMAELERLLADDVPADAAPDHEGT